MGQRSERRCLLLQVPALRLLLDSELEPFVDAFQHVQYQERDVIIRQGDVGDKFFVIQQGEVVAVKSFSDGQAPQELMRLTQGAQFGERALLYREPRAAHVVAVTPVDCLFITTDVFDKLMRAQTREMMEEQVREMERKTNRPKVKFKELEVFCTVGLGQFGRVRMVRHKYTTGVYALKTMSLATITDLRQVEHVQSERGVLEQLDCPFIVRLIGCYRDKYNLHLLTEFVPGGELFVHLDTHGTFTDTVAQFYAANVLLALEHMHAHGFIYRDVKPENCMLDRQGYLKLTDFGFAKHLPSGHTFTICGTPDYQAPEIITREGHTRTVDIWALGVFIYELLVGQSPFRETDDDDIRDIFNRILSGTFSIPQHVCPIAAQAISGMLQRRSAHRLGCGRGGLVELKRHPWFASIDWEALALRRTTPPHVPTLKDDLDLSYFQHYDEEPAHQAAGISTEGPEWTSWEPID